MKKIAFLAVGLIVVAGCGMLATQARAAEPAQPQIVGSSEAAVLQQELTVLSTLLNQLSAQIDANQSPANRAEVSSNLAMIENELLSLRSTIASLDSQASALAESNAAPVATPSQIIAQAPQSQISNTAPAADSEIQPAATPLPPATDRNNTVASAQLVGGLKNFFWPALLVLAIASGIFFLRKKKAEEPEMGYDEEMFSSLPTITDY